MLGRLKKGKLTTLIFCRELRSHRKRGLAENGRSETELWKYIEGNFLLN